MSDMEDRLNSILGNPQMMQQIMSMAQALGQQPASEPEPSQGASPVSLDPAMLSRLSGLMGQSGIDREQQALLKALSPYLSRNKITKLEKAMRSAKLARLASTFLNQGGLSMLTGR